MNLLLICEIAQGLPLPDFGEALAAHIKDKKHPDLHAASCTAWNLLALGLKRMGIEKLPVAAFEDTGKPYFSDFPLYFSLSHSFNFASALISTSPCAVDIECIRPETGKKLYARCLSPAEQAAGCDFFEIWTKKECMAKLSGRGLPARPCEMNTLEAFRENAFHCIRIHDPGGQEYVLCALCPDEEELQIQKIMPEELD